MDDLARAEASCFKAANYLIAIHSALTGETCASHYQKGGVPAGTFKCAGDEDALGDRYESYSRLPSSPLNEIDDPTDEWVLIGAGELAIVERQKSGRTFRFSIRVGHRVVQGLNVSGRPEETPAFNYSAATAEAPSARRATLAMVEASPLLESDSIGVAARNASDAMKTNAVIADIAQHLS